MGEAKRRQAAAAGAPEAPMVVVRLSERQRNRVQSAFAEADAAVLRAQQALTDVLIGKEVDLDQYERWTLSPDREVALLTPKPSAGPDKQAPEAPSGGDG